eukprot:1158747-Pelagomonas_calceolata.AAC.20
MKLERHAFKGVCASLNGHVGPQMCQRALQRAVAFRLAYSRGPHQDHTKAHIHCVIQLDDLHAASQGALPGRNISKHSTDLLHRNSPTGATHF